MIRGKSSGRPSGVPRTLDAVLRTWFEQGISNREMAFRLQVSDPAIHRALARLGLHRRKQLLAALAIGEDAEEGVSRDPPGRNDREPAETTPETRETSKDPGHLGFLEAAKVDVENASVGSPAEESGRVQRKSSTADGACELAEEACHRDPIVGECGARGGGESPRVPQGTEVLVEAEDGVLQRPIFGELLEDVLASYEEKGFTIDRDPDE